MAEKRKMLEEMNMNKKMRNELIKGGNDIKKDILSIEE